MNKLTNLFRIITRSPILWGGLAAAGFFGLVHGGPLATPFILRYFTHHPVEYAETVMFAVGLAALVLKILDVLGQFPGLRQSPLGPASISPRPADEQSGALLERLDRLPQHRRAEYYVRRLRSALEHVRRLGSAEGLGDEIKYLADQDAARAHASYGLFRVIVWAIPIMGFLGTVIGITMALNGVIGGSSEDQMGQVMTGLGVKFDTTALALSMAMALMFVHFFAERLENALLEQVDRRTEADLGGRFQQLPAGADGQLLAMRRMAEAMIQASERLVQRQAELWKASMEEAAVRWTRTAEATGEQLKKAVAAALAESLKTHAQQLLAGEAAMADQSRRHWEKLLQSQVQQTEALAALQAGVVQQADVLGRAVAASGEVTRLEHALNQNLSTLAGAKHFEQTVMGLAATIHLLNARLTEAPPALATIELEPKRRNAKAA
ncbi:MAG: MotA/TolQ/ExbB proton channel family protein [Thermoguttaceae bacterium]